MNARGLWSNILTIVGGIGMAVGAIDPLEGSLLILPGSGLLALGTYLGRAERREIACQVWAFVLLAIGIGAVCGLSLFGGVGGDKGLSMWWGLLILPYPIGWALGMWGPGSPRWLAWLGIVVGLWYQAILVLILARMGLHISGRTTPAIVVSAYGWLTICGCIYRLSRQRKAGKAATNAIA